MLTILLLGILIFSFGVFMLAQPLVLANGIRRFSEKAWFHKFEIISRGLLGLLSLAVARFTQLPTVFMIIGYLFCFVAIFLCFLGEKKHRNFATLVSNFGLKFRFISPVPMLLGIVLIYLSLNR